MCLLIHKPAGVKVDADLLEAGARGNRDSWGVAAVTNEGVWVDKGLNFARDETVTGQKPVDMLTGDDVTNLEAVIHFRMANVGAITLENAHPICTDVNDIWVAHNGTFNIFDVGRNRMSGQSDTYKFAKWLGKMLSAVNAEFFTDDNDLFWSGVGDVVGNWNKVAIVSPHGVRLLNEAAGKRLESGIWVSNLTYKAYSHDERYLPLHYSSYRGDDGVKSAEKDGLTTNYYTDSKRYVCEWCQDCGHRSCKTTPSLGCYDEASEEYYHAESKDKHSGWCVDSPRHEGFCVHGMRRFYDTRNTILCVDCYENYGSYLGVAH